MGHFWPQHRLQGEHWSHFKWKNKYIINYYFYHTIFVDNVIFEILTILMTNVYLNLTNFVLSGICFVIEYCRVWKVRGCLLAKLVPFKSSCYWGVLTLGESVEMGIEKVLAGSKNILNFIARQNQKIFSTMTAIVIRTIETH